VAGRLSTIEDSPSGETLTSPEIDVTEEMREAGAEVLARLGQEALCGLSDLTLEWLAESVYVAMTQTARQQRARRLRDRNRTLGEGDRPCLK
jgi:hypothetical protein